MTIIVNSSSAPHYRPPPKKRRPSPDTIKPPPTKQNTHTPVYERLHRRLGVALEVLLRPVRQGILVYLVRVDHQQVAKIELDNNGKKKHSNNISG